MALPLLTLTNMGTGVTFFHVSDELAFLEWLQKISCVDSMDGQGKWGLIVRLKRQPGNHDLRSLIALCYRYGVDMRQLTKFETAANRSWFRDPHMYWYKAVFGKRRASPRRR